MEVTESTVKKLVLTNLDRLDPVTVITEDFGPGQGKLTIDCYGRAWTAYWGGMGAENIKEFISTAEVEYLADKLTNMLSQIIDYEAISEKLGETVEHATLILYGPEMVSAYGPDWYHDLPMTTNPDYKYLCRIVSVVKESVQPLP